MVYKEKIPVITRVVKLALAVLLIFGAQSLAIAQVDEESGDDTDSPCENKWGPDSALGMRNLSMFNQYFQEKNWVKIMQYWTYLFNNAPCASKRVTVNGPYIIKQALLTDSFDSRKNGLYDTILLCYPKRIELYGDKTGAVLGAWGRDLAALKPLQRDTGFQMMYRSMKKTGNNTSYTMPTPFMVTAQKLHDKKQLSLDSLFMSFEFVSGIIDYNINLEDTSKLKIWKAVRAQVTKVMLPYLDCDTLLKLKQPEFEKKKNDLNYLKTTIFMMSQGNCSGSDFYIRISEQYYSVEPSARTALVIAKAFLNISDYAKAEKYLMEALPGVEGSERHDVFIKLAQINLQNGKLAVARDYARKALEINPNSGDAYIAIGDAYAQTKGCLSSECKELGGREVYWVAVDMYAKAKQVDTSVTEKANSKIAKYSAYFPDKEDAFFCGLIDGSAFRVGCWIGETTTVRTISRE
jgi:tetratricopeptide (TPR) repeat protein